MTTLTVGSGSIGAELPAHFLNTKSLSSGFVSAAFDPDYSRNGIFYTVHTEEGWAIGGAIGEGRPGMVTNVPQDLTVAQGKILRIDPRGTNGANGQYGIPASNPFAGNRASHCGKSTPLACAIRFASAGT